MREILVVLDDQDAYVFAGSAEHASQFAQQRIFIQWLCDPSLGFGG